VITAATVGNSVSSYLIITTAKIPKYKDE